MRAIVHTRPDCMPCKATKRRLTALGAEWVEVSITEEKARESRKEGILQAPVVEVIDEEWDDEVVERWGGFDPDKIDRYFKK